MPKETWTPKPSQLLLPAHVDFTIEELRSLRGAELIYHRDESWRKHSEVVMECPAYVADADIHGITIMGPSALGAETDEDTILSCCNGIHVIESANMIHQYWNSLQYFVNCIRNKEYRCQSHSQGLYANCAFM